MEKQEMEVREARVQTSAASLKGLDSLDDYDEDGVAKPRVVVETTGLKGSRALFHDRGLREIENSVKTE